MSNLATVKSTTNEVAGTLVLTKYGMKRILERVENSDFYTPLNICKIGVGNKMVLSYDSSIQMLRNEVAVFDIKPEDIVLDENTCTIKSDLSITEGIAMQEIGIYEVIRGKRYLFAYASGFSMVANEDLSYTLVIDLALHISFKDVDYNKYKVSIGEVEYAHHPDVVGLYNDLSNVQLDLERCVQANSRELGLNRAETFYKERRKLSELIQTTLLFGRYQKFVSKFVNSEMTDCFYYPETDLDSYSIRNLQDPKSHILVNNELQCANVDNINFSIPATIMCTANIGSMEKVGVIFGKIDPKKDRYYLDFRISSDDVTDPSAEKFLQFTIYSYDLERAQQSEGGIIPEEEVNVVGHYRIKCYLTDALKQAIIGNDATYTFVYNGEEEDANVDFYINSVKMNVIEDKFNFTKFPKFEDLYDKIIYDPVYDGETKPIMSVEQFLHLTDYEEFVYTLKDYVDREFLEKLKRQGDKDMANYYIRVRFYETLRKACSLKNFTSYTETVPYETPIEYEGHTVTSYEDTKYYYLDSVKISSIIAFNKALSEPEIQYLALVSQG